MLRVTSLIALLVGGLLMQSADAFARGSRNTPVSELGPVQGSLRQPQAMSPDDRKRSNLTPDDAAREIQKRHGGRVLSVQSDGAGYRVKMLKNGEVRIYQITP